MVYYYAFFAALSTVISIVYLMVWRTHFNALLSLIHVAIPIVCFAALLRSTSSTLEGALYCNSIVCIFGAFVTPTMLFGIVQLLGHKLNRKVFFVVILVQILIYASVLTNEHTGLYLNIIGLGSEYGSTIIVKTPGPMSYVLVVSIVIYASISLFLLIRALLSKKGGTVSKSALRFAVADVVIMSALFIYFEIYFEFSQFGVFYFVALQLAMFVLSTSAADAYLEPYAYDVLDSADGVGVVSFDNHRRILVRSPLAVKWFPELATLEYRMPIGDEHGFNGRMKTWSDAIIDGGDSFTVIEERNGLSIKLAFSMRMIDDQVRYCCYMYDVTAQQDLLKIMSDNIESIRSTMSKYVDPNLLRAMIGQTDVAKEGRDCVVAVMFADIRGFSAVSETLDSRDTIKILNRYLTLAEQAVHSNGGILDKYIGDAVMAFWIDADEDGTAARLAAKTALEIKSSIIEIEDQIFAEVGSELFYGIGLNYGRAVFGNIGSEEQSGLTVIGDVVNMAARFENLAPKSTIYTSRAFCDALGDSFEVKLCMKDTKIKGKSSLVDIYEIVSQKTDLEITESRQKTSLGEPVPARAVFHVCGCRGSYSVSGERFSRFGGQTTCYVLKRGRHAMVIDCGSGLSNAAPILKDCDRIDVLLTHMHYDHCIGLLNWGVFPSDVPLTFYGNFSAWNGKDSISDLFRHPYWPIDMSRGEMVDIAENPVVELAPDLTARFLEAFHPNDAKLIMFEVDGKRLCVMGDNESVDSVSSEELSNLDYLVYDGMYDDEDYSQHIGWGHSTWQSGVRVAKQSNVKLLIVSHHDINSSDAVLLDRERRAQEIYPATVFARIGDRYEL